MAACYFVIAVYLLFPVCFVVCLGRMDATILVLNLKALEFLGDSALDVVFILVNLRWLACAPLGLSVVSHLWLYLAQAVKLV